jgi:FkbM family methyltransferase
VLSISDRNTSRAASPSSDTAAPCHAAHASAKIMNYKRLIRRAKIYLKKLLGIEPRISIEYNASLERHGSEYGGWCILRESLSKDAVVVDIGLGEDTSFSESIADKYGCSVYGFDPTPRAIAHIEKQVQNRIRLMPFAVGAKKGQAVFYLPNDSRHVSGTLLQACHVGSKKLLVDVVTMEDVRDQVGGRIDLLKMDIEGAEYELLQSNCFAAVAPTIKQICIEFHHRWREVGKTATLSAVSRLSDLGFSCAWISDETNEEFLFIREDVAPARGTLSARVSKQN